MPRELYSSCQRAQSARAGVEVALCPIPLTEAHAGNAISLPIRVVRKHVADASGLGNLTRHEGPDGVIVVLFQAIVLQGKGYEHYHNGCKLTLPLLTKTQVGERIRAHKHSQWASAFPCCSGQG